MDSPCWFCPDKWNRYQRRAADLGPGLCDRCRAELLGLREYLRTICSTLPLLDAETAGL